MNIEYCWEEYLKASYAKEMLKGKWIPATLHSNVLDQKKFKMVHRIEVAADDLARAETVLDQFGLMGQIRP